MTQASKNMKKESGSFDGDVVLSSTLKFFWKNFVIELSLWPMKQKFFCTIPK